jgi:signal transduction histidine kinase/DNA-binding response OmpR family regulator
LVKRRDISIGTQTGVGLFLILSMVAGLAILSAMQGYLLWGQTRDLYEHPLKVRSALGDLRTGILVADRGVQGLFVVDTDEVLATDLQDVDVHIADASRQFQLIRSGYLGPSVDVDDASDAFARWIASRHETIRLLRTAERDDAAARSRSGGADGVLMDELMARLAKIGDFALQKGDQFYVEALERHESLNRQLIGMIVAILLLSMLVGWVLMKAIKEPIAELTAAALGFRHGQRDVRVRFASANELGVLAAAFNDMADQIQGEALRKQNAAELADVLLRQMDPRDFCRELLAAIMVRTGSQLGAVYLLNQAGTDFELFESVGMTVGGRASFSASGMEGEIGAALATRQIQRLSSIPPDTRFVYAAASGQFLPREILTIPIVSGDLVTAVISLASLRDYPESAVCLVNDVWLAMAGRLNAMLDERRIRAFAVRLEEQNRELDQQTTELTGQNTELEFQKRQLDEANRLKSTFLANMSHELRTPLNSVIALAGVLGRRMVGKLPDEELGFLEIIGRNGKHLLALINDILDLSRIEAGKEELRFVRFDTSALAAEIVDMVGPQAAEKGLVLHNRVAADLPLLASDLDKCRHILQNLVGNAVKFTEQGEIVITATVTGDRMAIAVADTGIGIPEDRLAIIFDEFRQGDDSTSRRYGGSGLGLAIARRYARLLGGDVLVSSVPGSGSLFTLDLPFTDRVSDFADAPATTVPPSLGQLPAVAGQGQVILLVEDSEPAIVQMTEILQSQGYRVDVARNGREGIERLAGTLPDAMILDLMMPDVDGFQVLQEMRAAPRTREVPVLILTARHVSREELSILKGNHIHQLIQKGDIDRSGLIAAVARMVAPLAAGARQDPATPFCKRRPTRQGKPLILVVEDNLDNMRTARALLEDTYEIIEARDGQSAVDEARRRLPDVILMDIALPVLDGIQALAVLRRDEILRGIPVFAVTASAMTGDREKIMAHGFDAYISKPIDHDQLMKALCEALGG